MVQIECIGQGASKHQLAEHMSADYLGAKAANLAHMAALGLPVPPAFVLPIKLCAALLRGDSHAERSLLDGLRQGIEYLEKATGKSFGDRRNPLLVSVRSGAARSMPGMLDSVLNVGCTETALRGLIRTTGNPRFAWDCRRRFVEEYATTVLGLDAAPFAAQLARMIEQEGAGSDRALDSEALERLAAGYKVLIDDDDLPDDPMDQLVTAARAVFHSWMSDRAQTYRALEHLDYLHGTAVTVQAMVFGNRGRTSGAGVAFSRDPSNGANKPVIDVLFDAQGEDVVSGRRTPETEEAIARHLPSVAAELHDVLARLEHEFGDVQDIEFTIDDGRLWILQTRAAKRTPHAALRIAIDLVHQGLITPSEALHRVDALDLNEIVRSHLVDAENPIACGVAASAGIAVGRAAFDSTSAERLASVGDPVILLRPDISTSDVAGFAAAAGIVTAIGGRTAHAALVARQMGKPCVVGCGSLTINPDMRRAKVANAVIEEGDWVSIDGDNGGVYLGRREVVVERPDDELAEIARWRAAVDTHAQHRQVSPAKTVSPVHRSAHGEHRSHH